MSKLFQKSLWVAVGAALGLAVVDATPALAALTIDSESAVANLNTREVLFTIEFSEIPDFLTLDSVGRQADSFQYFIDADGEFPVLGNGYEKLEAIIRGEEIHVSGDLRVRNALPSDLDDPNSGGWGSIRGSVPFALDGTVLRFSVPFQLIGDTDGLFSYLLESYEFGGLMNSVPERLSVVETTSVPEPSATLGFLALAACGASLTLLKKFAP